MSTHNLGPHDIPRSKTSEDLNLILLRRPNILLPESPSPLNRSARNSFDPFQQQKREKPATDRMIPWNSSLHTVSPTTKIPTVACRGLILVTLANTVFPTCGRKFVNATSSFFPPTGYTGRRTESICFPPSFLAVVTGVVRCGCPTTDAQICSLKMWVPVPGVYNVADASGWPGVAISGKSGVAIGR